MEPNIPEPGTSLNLLDLNSAFPNDDDDDLDQMPALV